MRLRTTTTPISTGSIHGHSPGYSVSLAGPIVVYTRDRTVSPHSSVKGKNKPWAFHGTFDTWIRRFILDIGNDASANRPWNGEPQTLSGLQSGLTEADAALNLD